MIERRPIGIFDSGIGGLTVARAIYDLLPNESLLYFGDTAHLPYGEKSPELIRRYSSRITQHLVESGCKAIVVACNSASSNAIEAIVEAAGPNVPVIDMVTPVIRSISAEKGSQIVGLIGTRATISSGLYSKTMNQLNANSTLVSRATPLLASAIEEGFFNDSIPGAVLEAYFADDSFNKIDSIILGCTHYPLVKEKIQALLPKGVKVIDSPKIIAQELKRVLTENSHPDTPEHKFQVSDLTKNFIFSAHHFFGSDINLEEVSFG
ncbi:MAG: glutamate racemase [Bacteroidetes bacterium]|nr:glutamate racemase [Bacteroidota bacterium]MDA0731366.1 glutamate racemase [Bacteroidota bacterium]MDA0979915.1 glutamate racemase [Bacteroidota bacterium]